MNWTKLYRAVYVLVILALLVAAIVAGIRGHYVQGMFYSGAAWLYATNWKQWEADHRIGTLEYLAVDKLFEAERENWPGRERKVATPRPSHIDSEYLRPVQRTYVIAATKGEFDDWCHRQGYWTRDRLLVHVTEPHQLRGLNKVPLVVVSCPVGNRADWDRELKIVDRG